MKKVVVPVYDIIEHVPVNLCDTRWYYGARKVVSPGWRVVIMRNEFAPSANYRLRCFDDFTLGNYWYVKENTNLEWFLRGLISEGWEVRQFETMKELAEWLNV